MANLNTYKLFKKGQKKVNYFVVLFFGLLSINSMVACQKSKSKSTPPPISSYQPNYYNNNISGGLCPTCNMNVPWTVFANTNSQSGLGSVSLALDIYGDPNTGYDFYNPSIPVMYTGPVVVAGMLTINAVDSLICSVPVGTYQIISLSPGQWQSGVVSSTYSGYGPTALHMEARSQFGVSIILRLAQGVIYNPAGTSSQYPNNLAATLVFESVNGAPCMTYSGQAAYAQMY